MVDVCLVVEGSYPEVTGGVSSWADRLVRGAPELRFAVAHLRDGGETAQAPAHELPDNVDSLVHIDLDPQRLEPGPEVFGELPRARVYHVACTGSAGALAEAAADEHGAGLLLTEHGLAAREVWWGPTGCKPHFTDLPSGCKPHFVPLDPRRRAEIAASVGRMARSTYARADVITSVCSSNVRAQVGLGAPLERVRVVPNAAPLASTRGRKERGNPLDGQPFRACFIGRVVAIKDVETFLRACALVAIERPEAEFAVVGPLHHEPGYAERCLGLAARLGLTERVVFTGVTDPEPWYRWADVVALTSLSEAQPLVALEAMGSGVPVVATAVGGCAETIAGAGLLTPARSPRATADALLRLAADPDLRERLGAAGRRRVALRHRPQHVHGAYRALYEQLAA